MFIPQKRSADHAKKKKKERKKLWPRVSEGQTSFLSGLSVAHPVVATFSGQQFLVGTDFRHVTSVYDNNDVSVLYGGQTVGYHDAGTAFLGLV